jgi:hypothetical protein
MLHPALYKLMRLQGRGMLRRMVRGMGSPRGSVFFGVGLLIFALWLLSIGMAVNQPRPALAHVRVVAPIILLGVCLLSALTSVGERAIAFTPGEVDFLFPGPFGRRQLLVYKLTKSTIANLLTALIMSIALRRYATLWVACYVGVFLSLLFIQFASTSLLLLAQSVTEQAFSRGRKWALAGIALLIVLGLRGIVGIGSLDFPALAEQFAATETGKVLLAPFNIYGRAITAERVFPDLIEWAAGAALIDAALLAVVVRLDANYLEAAAGATQRRYERLRRIRGGGALAQGTRGNVRRGLPGPPYLFGAGPLAWRQATNALRSAWGLLVVLVVLAILFAKLFIPSHPRVPGAPMDQAVQVLAGLGVVVVAMSILAASLLKFDFRADLDSMESLKALPLRPWSIATGELVTPILVLTLVHWVLIATLAGTFGRSSEYLRALACMAVMVLPFNCLLFAAENLIFLLFPMRPAAVGPGDFQVLGRQIVTHGLRAFLVFIGATVALIFGGLVYHLAHRSLIALVTITSILLLAEAAAMVPLLGWAFTRFDPSRHTPAA